MGGEELAQLAHPLVNLLGGGVAEVQAQRVVMPPSG